MIDMEKWAYDSLQFARIAKQSTELVNIINDLNTKNYGTIWTDTTPRSEGGKSEND